MNMDTKRTTPAEISRRQHAKHDKFARGSGAYHCSDCGRLTRETGLGESQVELCRACYIADEQENSRQDDGQTPQGEHHDTRKSD